MLDNDGRLTIRDSITSIEKAAFCRCTGFTCVVIPNSVTSIGERAFSDCTGMTSVSIPHTVTSIGERAFEGCTGLTTVVVSDSVSSIQKQDFERAFQGAPAHVVALAVAARQQSELNCLSKLLMKQFSKNASTTKGPVFDAPKVREEAKAWHIVACLRSGFWDSKIVFTPTPTSNPAATASTFQRMLEAQPAPLQPDTAPLSERVSSIKDVLNICLHFEVTAPPDPTIYSTVDFGPHMQMYVDPAIAIIKQTVETMKDEVAADPGKYRRLLASISSADKKIYKECFSKTINSTLGGDEAAYTTMLQKISDLQSGCTMVEVHVQPTSELIPLILMIRENVPAYRAIVMRVVDSCGPDIQQVVVSFRHETKAPYRIIEKSLTKGPNREYLDCSKVLDIFGCIIDCPDYVSMAAVVAAFAAKHQAGDLQLSRIKDRWTHPSSGGWRDLMFNLVINDVIFEVQITHSKMLGARKGMDAHKAYNQFRSFAEIFNMLDLDPGMGGRRQSTVNEEENVKLSAEVAQLHKYLEAKQEAYVASQTTLAVTELYLEAERAAHAAERAAHASDISAEQAVYKRTACYFSRIEEELAATQTFLTATDQALQAELAARAPLQAALAASQKEVVQLRALVAELSPQPPL